MMEVEIGILDIYFLHHPPIKLSDTPPDRERQDTIIRRARELRNSLDYSRRLDRNAPPLEDLKAAAISQSGMYNYLLEEALNTEDFDQTAPDQVLNGVLYWGEILDVVRAACGLTEG